MRLEMDHICHLMIKLNKMLGLGPKDGNEHVNVLIKDKNIINEL